MIIISVIILTFAIALTIILVRASHKGRHDPLNYTCINKEKCIYKKYGQFKSEKECLKACGKSTKPYGCVLGECSTQDGGKYPSLSSCKKYCAPPSPTPSGGNLYKIKVAYGKPAFAHQSQYLKVVPCTTGIHAGRINGAGGDDGTPGIFKITKNSDGVTYTIKYVSNGEDIKTYLCMYPPDQPYRGNWMVGPFKNLPNQDPPCQCASTCECEQGCGSCSPPGSRVSVELDKVTIEQLGGDHVRFVTHWWDGRQTHAKATLYASPSSLRTDATDLGVVWTIPDNGCMTHPKDGKSVDACVFILEEA